MANDMASPLLEELSAGYDQPPVSHLLVAGTSSATSHVGNLPGVTMHHAHGFHVRILKMVELKNHLDSVRKVGKMEEVDSQYHRVTQRQRALV